LLATSWDSIQLKKWKLKMRVVASSISQAWQMLLATTW
jgi:hypothetical protein